MGQEDIPSKKEGRYPSGADGIASNEIGLPSSNALMTLLNMSEYLRYCLILSFCWFCLAAAPACLN